MFCFDINPTKIEILAAGCSYTRHIDGAGARRLPCARRFDATTDFFRLGEVYAILVWVPTPLTRQREPDLNCVVETTRQIAPTLRQGQLIVLQSTTYPGTVAEVMKPILEQGGRVRVAISSWPIRRNASTSATSTSPLRRSRKSSGATDPRP